MQTGVTGSLPLQIGLKRSRQSHQLSSEGIHGAVRYGRPAPHVAYASDSMSAGGRRYPRQKARAAAARLAQPPVSSHRLITSGGSGGSRTVPSGGATLPYGPRGGEEGGKRNRLPRRLVWISKPLQQCNPISRPKKADRRTVRAAPAFDSNQGASEPDRDRF